MSIVKMSRLRIVAPQSIRRSLLSELARSGCVEIENSADFLTDPQWSAVLHRLDDPGDSARKLNALNSALEALGKYAPVKSGFLTPRRQITEQAFKDPQKVEEALAAAEQLNTLTRQIASLYAEEGRLTAKKAVLIPWKSMDIPLGKEFGTQFKVLFGVCPSGIPSEVLLETANAIEGCALSLVSSDREQHYLLLVSHLSALNEALDQLKAKGFSLVSFKDIQGTAADNLAQLDRQLAELDRQRGQEIAGIQALSPRRESLEQALDALTIEAHRDDVLSGLTATAKTVYLEGWLPSEAEGTVRGILENQGCAYEFSAPLDEEEPPILLHDPVLMQPYGMVSELYALPTYRGLDPVPFMAPFFFIYFGLMMADVGYGVLITLGGWLLLKKARPQGGLKDMANLAVQCGISTIFWGVMFGSYFGNVITAFTTNMLGRPVTIAPVLFDPLTNPIPLFIISVVFGIIQLFTGMGLNAYGMIRRGDLLGAICDIGFWYMLLGGFIVCIVNVKVGLAISAAGALGILLMAGRAHKSIVRRLLSGLGALYGATSYLADVLSYSRLLALSLATAVIAQVMNTMATLGGKSVIGWIFFILIFLVGHIFNLAINLLGTFVHTSRLQYIEFFGKFFESGGRKFAPLYNKTKYVEVIKEGK